MNLNIKNSANETLDYTFGKGSANSEKSEWIAILGHGVTGNKDRPIIKDTADALNNAGFDTLRFSFAGNGESGGDFREATISKEVGDLNAVINAVSNEYKDIVYIGHSMGAAVGVIQTATDDRITALISIAGMIDTKAFATTEFGEETPDEGLMWEEESCPLSSVFMDDLCKKIVSVEPTVSSVKTPWLLLHGSKDDVVDPKDSNQVKAIQGESVTLRIIEGADHSFNDASYKKEALDILTNWLDLQSLVK